MSDDADRNKDLNDAARRNDVEQLRQLLSGGANPNFAQGTGEGSPLIYACDEGHIEAARVLISYGADVNYQSEVSDTPLSCAIGRKHVDLVRLLISAGADVMQVDVLGDHLTPLDHARRFGNPEIVRMIETALEEKTQARP